jgi:pimeloyl-ACP methyl ester carboxylesterase
MHSLDHEHILALVEAIHGADLAMVLQRMRHDVITRSSYGRPGAMHSAFNQFAAFTLHAVDNKAFAASGKLNMPVLALGGDHSFGTQMADIMRLVATDVTGGVITDSGHWVMEEQSKQTTTAIMNFLDQL